MNTLNKLFWAFLAGIVLLWVGGGTPVNADQPKKVTLCHVAGREDDPANHITLTLPWVAVYGQAGHFNENGTTQAGHEQDYLGECDIPDTTVPTTVPETTVSETTVPDSTVPVTITSVTTDPENTTQETFPETIPNVCMFGNSYTEDILPYGDFILMDSEDPRVVGTHAISGIPCGPLTDISTPPTVTPVSNGTLPATGSETFLAWIAAIVLVGGICLTAAARRNRNI